MEKSTTEEAAEAPQEGRPRREQQITDFKSFHTTGSKGKVAAAVHRIETPQKDGAGTEETETRLEKSARRELHSTLATEEQGREHSPDTSGTQVTGLESHPERHSSQHSSPHP